MKSHIDRMRKFMQSVGDSMWRELVLESKKRDVSVQELIRVEIIPMWMESREAKKNDQS